MASAVLHTCTHHVVWCHEVDDNHLVSLVKRERAFKHGRFGDGAGESVDEEMMVGGKVGTHCVAPQRYRKEERLQCAGVERLAERVFGIAFAASREPAESSSCLNIDNLSLRVNRAEILLKQRDLRSLS